MSIENNSTRLEIDEWAGEQLSSSELGELTAYSLGIVSMMVNSLAEPDCEAVKYQAIAELLDDDARPERVIQLRAFGGPWIEDWEYEPLVMWSVRAHLDERLVALSGYYKAASLYRRTFVRIEPRLPQPIRITRSHELRRRSDHRFHKPKNGIERAALYGRENFNRTGLVQADRILIEGMLAALEETVDKAEYVEGEFWE